MLSEESAAGSFGKSCEWARYGGIYVGEKQDNSGHDGARQDIFAERLTIGCN